MTTEEIKTMIENIDNAIAIQLGKPIEYQIQSAESTVMAKRHTYQSLLTLRAYYDKLLRDGEFNNNAILGRVR